MNVNEAKIAFFGGEPLGVPTLDALKKAGILPELIVCNPDRPAGRGQKLTAPPVKEWALQNGIEVFQPESYKNKEDLELLTTGDWDLFIVVAYNFILPGWLLSVPGDGVLNVHPSLLPKLRGPSPIRSAIKNDLREAVGVSVMLMDNKMDHGPILKQEKVDIDDKKWPLPGPELDSILAETGGSLLAEVIPAWLSGDITPEAQQHDHATYSKLYNKEDAQIAIDPHELPTGETARADFHHICAFQGMGDSYFVHNDQRVKIKQAELAENGSLRLLRVTPAGKAEMDFEHYLQTIS